MFQRCPWRQFRDTKWWCNRNTQLGNIRFLYKTATGLAWLPQRRMTCSFSSTEIYHIVSQSSTANDTPTAPELGERKPLNPVKMINLVRRSVPVVLAAPSSLLDSNYNNDLHLLSFVWKSNVCTCSSFILIYLLPYILGWFFFNVLFCCMHAYLLTYIHTLYV